MAAGAQIIPFPTADAPGDTRQQDAPANPDWKGRDISDLKRQFTNAVSAKAAENREAAEAEQYFHGSQWSPEDAKILKDRRQPLITFNRIKRKINLTMGVVEKMRQDPKAFPRNPSQASEDGAEIATAALRYALGWDWQDKSSHQAQRAGVRGIGGVEMVVTQGDRGDPEIELDPVDQRDFFYDPRSTKHDFSDARYLGTSRWVDLDEAQHKWPDHEEALASFVERGAFDYERGDDRQQVQWLNKPEKQVRIVDHWWMRGDQWCYTIYCGEVVLEEGPSPFVDEKNRSQCKYIMFSCEVDHQGDRYGFVRDWKSPQDEINQRRSKALYTLNSRKVLASTGAVKDVEKARRELARVDGWVEVAPGENVRFEMLDQQNAHTYQGNLEMLAEAKAEIDTYGPNPGLIGIDVPAESGRAIQLLQAAGIAELGTFILAYKHWKLRVYRAVWNAVQQFWTSERWIRVTDNEEMAQFIQVNGLERDEYGRPVIINQLSSLDVDIMIEEGPDTINTMADTFDALMAIAKNGMQIPPQIIIELSNLPSSTKKRVMEHLAKGDSDPMQAQAIQLKMAQEQEKLNKTRSETQLNAAKAAEIMIEAQRGPDGAPQQIDTQADLAKARLDLAKAAEIEAKITRPEQPDPGLFALNTAKAEQTRVQAQREAVRTQNLVQFGAEEPARIPPPKPPGGDNAQ